MTIVFTGFTVLMSIGAYIDIKNNNLNIGLIVISLIFITISFFLIYEMFSFNNQEIAKAVEGVVINTKTSRQNNKKHFAEILIEDKILVFEISRKLYYNIKEETPVWVYRTSNKTSMVCVLEKN